MGLKSSKERNELTCTAHSLRRSKLPTAPAHVQQGTTSAWRQRSRLSDFPMPLLLCQDNLSQTGIFRRNRSLQKWGWVGMWWGSHRKGPGSTPSDDSMLGWRPAAETHMRRSAAWELSNYNGSKVDICGRMLLERIKRLIFRLVNQQVLSPKSPALQSFSHLERRREGLLVRAQF